jgi:hypothetical protein
MRRYLLVTATIDFWHLTGLRNGMKEASQYRPRVDRTRRPPTTSGFLHPTGGHGGVPKAGAPACQRPQAFWGTADA